MSASDPYLRPVDNDEQGTCVRPDQLRMRFECVVDTLSPNRAIEHLQGGVAVLERGLGSPAFESAPASVRLRDVSASTVAGKSKRKASGRRDARQQRMSLCGEVLVTLPPTLDFWARAGLVAELTELARALRREGKRTEPEIVVTYARPEPRVADPDAHRDALVAAWVARARALADAAQTDEHPLCLRALRPPGEVTQRAISLEEVILTLDMDGRIDLGS